jgi:hypothetical protein
MDVKAILRTAYSNQKLLLFYFRYLDLPNKDGMKPGSLPDLTNCYVSVNPGGGGGDNNQCEEQGSPYSSVRNTFHSQIIYFKV